MGVIEEISGEVLLAVEAVPAGSVTTYGTIARLVGRGGPRAVARVLSTRGAEVCWWRVVRADGSIAEPLWERAVPLLEAEGVEVIGGVIDLSRFGAAIDP